MAVIQMTSGVPGAGKTYSRVRFLITDFLINNTGLYITNLPLNVDLIATDLSKKLKCTKKSIKDRIIIIPSEQLKEFQKLKNCRLNVAREYAENGNFPPAKYFESMNLSNAHIALDEFHLYFSKKTGRSIKDCWNDWIAEIRKNGCTFEAITQDVSQIPSEFMGKVSVRVDLMPLDITRDPFFYIKMYDWYQLRASLTGQTSQKVAQTETHKGALGKWVVSHVDKFAIVPEIYKYYHTSTRNDGRKTDGGIPPFKRLSKMGLFLWFLRRNFFTLFGRICLAIAFIWLCFFGGLSQLLTGFVSSLQYLAKSQIQKKKVVSKSAKKKVVKSVSKSPVFQKKNISNNSVKMTESEKKILNQEQKIKELEKKIELAKQADISGHKPVMFLDGYIYLRNGLFVTNNYKFKKGVYNGKSISKIDYQKRGYFLSDGQFVSM